MLWQQLHTAVDVPGDGQEAEVGLCLMENDAISFLPREPWRYEGREAEKRRLRPTATLARVNGQQGDGSLFSLRGDFKKSLD